MKEQDSPDASRAAMKQRALERWENEGGEIPDDPVPQSREGDGEIGLTSPGASTPAASLAEPAGLARLSESVNWEALIGAGCALLWWFFKKRARGREHERAPARIGSESFACGGVCDYLVAPASHRLAALFQPRHCFH